MQKLIMLRSALPLLLMASTAVVAPQRLHPVVFRDSSNYDQQEAQQSSSCGWKCMIFTLQWPAGFCQSLSNASLCHIPKNVTDWIIHGLWPLHPKNCCMCWPMFPSDVEKLEADLNVNWPSLLKTRSNYKFWHEEWRKHGVCACVDGINSPDKFFQLCLQLKHKFNIQPLLENAGITPSCDRPYKVAEVQKVLDPHLGPKYNIQCVTVKGREVWFQLEVSLYQNQTLGCHREEEHHQEGAEHHYQQGAENHYQQGAELTSSAHPCPVQSSFYYLPIENQRSDRPCGASTG